ncbi:hypothetical protein GYMLUDRAFT_197864 [Collybiopsis luxurians FD-317 M1]|uniref:NAD(P)-binding protein n=1 Tax=Collybiopsis luxurians FD-317 M1 TaxID=944289 RepID=A0A0D0C3N6_9AGAR|nr:hypothetical protein GYMLUDRAFT_197864 [Collybiopsis luxurians FD-317 M1]
MFGARETLELTDLHGKVAIVTGGNSGIGYATIQFLTEQGAKVYMGSRNEEKALTAIEQLQENLRQKNKTGGSVHWLRLDLLDPRLAERAAEEIIRKEKRLDILINNAAGGTPNSMTKDGLLEMMVVNYISHFVLTETLLPLLKSTAAEKDSDVRIINLTSAYHAKVKVDSFVGKETLNKQYGDTMKGHLYGVTKLANILHTKHLQSRLNSEGARITCITLHPGVVATPGVYQLFSSSGLLQKLLAKTIIPLFFQEPRQGAMNSAFAAASKQVAAARESTDEAEKKMYEGVYLMPIGKITEPSKYAKDERLQNELYETTREILDEMGL